MPYGWEGNRRFGVHLATHHGLRGPTRNICERDPYNAQIGHQVWGSKVTGQGHKVNLLVSMCIIRASKSTILALSFIPRFPSVPFPPLLCSPPSSILLPLFPHTLSYPSLHLSFWDFRQLESSLWLTAPNV